MKFRAEINVMPQKALLDPQGKAVSRSMQNIGLPEIDGVRIGKHIHLEIEAASRQEASEKVEEACRKLLVNQITETFDFALFENGK